MSDLMFVGAPPPHGAHYNSVAEFDAMAQVAINEPGVWHLIDDTRTDANAPVIVRAMERRGLTAKRRSDGKGGVKIYAMHVPDSWLDSPEKMAALPELPPGIRKPTRSVRYDNIAHELKQNPGAWALLDTLPTRSLTKKWGDAMKLRGIKTIERVNAARTYDVYGCYEVG